MTDFSFTNKAYDLLMLLKDEGLIKDKTAPKVSFTSVKDIRLMIDLVKIAYPLYANSTDKDILGFVKDIFGISPPIWQIMKANHENDLYRPVECWEILPGKTFKLLGTSYNSLGERIEFDYLYTFPTRELSLKEYAEYYDKVWKNACPRIKHEFKFRIGDSISYISAPNSIGKIKGKLQGGKWYPKTDPHKFYPNSYSVVWDNDTDVPLQYFFEETELINYIQKLEAEPMKTKLKKVKTNVRIVKIPITVTYDKYDPEEWINQKVAEGYDRAVYEKIISRNEKDLSDIGWVTKEKITMVKSKRYSKSRAKRQKEKRKQKHLANLTTYTQNPIELEDIRPFKHMQKNLHLHLLIEGLVMQQLVCIKHTPTNTVQRVNVSFAKKLTTEDTSYVYCSKKEWKEYQKIKKENSVQISEMGIDPVTETPMIRKYRRGHIKARKNSRLVKEQFINVVIPEHKETIISRKPTIKVYDYDENGNEKVGKEHFETTITVPEQTVTKRILVRVKPKRPVELTDAIIEKRQERSLLDKNKYYVKKNISSLSDLKVEFAETERRNDKFSDVEHWSTQFTAITEIVKAGGSFLQVKEIITNGAKFNWSDEKIKDFMRYIKLTIHGIFEGKKEKKQTTKIKKIYEFKVVKSLTRVDYSKLKYNLPKDNKHIVIKYNSIEGELINEAIIEDNEAWTIDKESKICTLRDIISWKYEKDEDFKDLIIDEGGGFTEVPIKFRKIISDNGLLTFFRKNFQKKLLKNPDKLPF